MKLKIYVSYIVILLIGFGLIACEGPTGPAGADGEQGPRGEEGTANVIYSEWMEIDWNISDETNFKQMLINEPHITEEFVNTGTILMYARNATLTVNIAIALPLLQGNDYLYFYALNGHETVSDGIVLMAESVDYSIPVNEFSDAEVRYVLLPGGVPAKMSDGFLQDYMAVKNYYDIPD